VTREEWDHKWWDIHQALVSVGKTPLQAFEEANRRMERTFGPRPPAPKVAKDSGPAGPPLWLKLLAPLAGVPLDMFTKLWDWLNGKKTLIGAIITGLAYIAGALPAVLPFFGVEAVLAAKIVGIAVTVVGVAHKIYKFIYKEDHP
jgi:VIT1/CCC1 family predicted Fe2+/Mn2+ transporter